MEEKAPIVLFIYNRPDSTKRLLDSLALNPEANQSQLYVFCDGPKQNCNIEVLAQISSTRSIVRSEKRFKEVIIIELESNRGLAQSIIDGVTQILQHHESVIVLEDDLIVAPYFLYYMNDSLNRYESELRVGQIGACNYYACGSQFPNFFFTPITDCLGWATWKNRWIAFETDSQKLYVELLKNDAKKELFNAYGSYNFMGMLEKQILNEVSSWAIRWQATCVLQNWLTLYPNPSMTQHIGASNFTHTNIDILPPLSSTRPSMDTIPVELNSKVIEAMKLGYAGIGDYYGKLKNRSIGSQFKNLFKKIIPL